MNYLISFVIAFLVLFGIDLLIVSNFIPLSFPAMIFGSILGATYFSWSCSSFF